MPEKGIPSLWSDMVFWTVLIGASVVKAITSPYSGGWPLAVSVFTGLFAGIILAPELTELIGGYPYLVTTLAVLTGEHAAKIVIDTARDPVKALDKALDWLECWRGRR